MQLNQTVLIIRKKCPQASWIYGILCCLLTSPTWASLNLPLTPVLALSAGPAFYHAGQTQNIQLQPHFSNTYVANTPQNALSAGELFVGVQRPITSWGWAQLGVALVTTSYAQLQGHLWENSDPLFDNFTYQYRITHAHVALKTKWLTQAFSSTLFPYVSASVGLARNRSSSFSTTALLFEEVPVPGFQNHTQQAFTYTLGIGIHKMANEHWQIGVGYDFGDWGASALARAPQQTMSNGLQLNHLYTQQLVLTMNYLF